MKTTPFLLLAALLVPAAASAQHGGHGAATPYAGLQSREIKALSAEEAQGLAEGQGMRLALAAELNGYPGPAHVLEHADALALTPQQRGATQALMHSHKAEARALGAQLLAAERELDRTFAGQAAREEQVTRLSERIGTLQGQLRAAHLRTHLQQTALLSPQQVALYQRLRGYAGENPNPQGTHR